MRQPDHSNKPILAEIFSSLLIGSSDGIIVPMAMYALMTSVGMGPGDILHIGLMVTPAIGLVFGIGGWLTRRNAELQPRNFLQEEMQEATKGKERPDKGVFLSRLGLTEEMQQQALDEMKKDDLEWDQFTAQYNNEEASIANIPAAAAGLIIGLSYGTAGLLMLLPFVLLADAHRAFAWSAGTGLVTLFLLGCIKARITRQRIFTTAGPMLLMAILAAGGAWLVAGLFK